MRQQIFTWQTFLERLGAGGQYAQRDKIEQEFLAYDVHRVVCVCTDEWRVIDVILEYDANQDGSIRTAVLPREYFS